MRKLFDFRIYLTILLCVVAFFVTGCGSNSSQPPTTTSTQTETSGTANASTKGSALKDTVLKIGRIPFTNATDMVRKHEGLLNYLREELGLKEARLVLAPSYTGIVTKLASGEIDIGWLGTLSYVEAKDKFNLKLLVKPKRFKTTSYRGIIITREDSGIRTLADLKGKRFAWVEKDSASGYIFPKALLLEAKIDPEKDFAEAGFLSKHDAVVLNVLLGKYDAGACYDDARNTLRDKSKINELTILATTQDISNEPLFVRPDLPEDLCDKIKKAFLKLNIDNPVYKKVLEDCTDVQGFVSAADSDYDYVRKMIKLLQSH